MKKIILLVSLFLFLSTTTSIHADGVPKVHWAASSTNLLSSLGYQDVPNTYETTLTAKQWEDMTIEVFAPVLKKETEDYEKWIQTYTHLNDGKLTREWAVGGLVKLLNMAGKASGSFEAKDAKLKKTFLDGDNLVGKNYALWEVGYSIGLIKGYPGNELNPGKELTFAEGAVFLARAYNLLHE